MSFSEYALVYRNGINTHLAQTVYGRTLYGMPAVESHRTVSVDSSFAGYRDIRTLVCVDKGGEVETFCSFPFCQQITGRKSAEVSVENSRRAPSAMCRFYVTFQCNGSFDEIISRGMSTVPPPFVLQMTDGLEDGGTAVESCIAFAP